MTLAILFFVVATELIGFGLIIPLMPQIINDITSNPLKIGFLLASYSLAQMLAAPLLGRLSDRYGRKPVLIFSKLGTALAYLLFALSKTYLLILISRLIDGFTGGNISVARAYAADVSEKDKQHQGMAIIGIAFGTGFILGPALGGFLYTAQWGHYMAGIVASALSFFACLLTIFLLKEPSNRQTRSWNFFSLPQFMSMIKKPAVGIIFLTYFAYLIFFSSFETSFAVFMHERFNFTTDMNSKAFLFIGLVALLIQGSFARNRKAKPKGYILTGLYCTSIAFLGLALSYNLITLFAALFVLCVGVSCLNTFLPSALAEMTSESERGGVYGMYESIGSLSRILGPLLIYFAFSKHFSLGYLVFSLFLFCFSIVFSIFSARYFTKS